MWIPVHFIELVRQQSPECSPNVLGKVAGFPPKPATPFFSTASFKTIFSPLKNSMLAAMTAAIEIPGPLRRLLELPNLTDLLLIGSQSTFLDLGKGLELAANPFDSDQELNKVLITLALQMGGQLDLSNPIGDFSHENFRFHAVLHSSISKLPMLTVRKHPKTKVLLRHLLEVKMLTAQELEFLVGIIKRRENFLIFGATGSGKTTLLSAMLHETKDRSVVIEQLAELHLPLPSVNLLERKANIEGVGKITTQELLIEALRMRPDRVIVGEARGSELVLLLQAMNNGHRGSGATIHADKFSEIPNRLTVLGLLAGMDPMLTARLAAGAIDWVIQLRKSPTRKISQIGKLEISAGQLAVCEFQISQEIK